jgi:hypothetical protein
MFFNKNKPTDVWVMDSESGKLKKTSIKKFEQITGKTWTNKVFDQDGNDLTDPKRLTDEEKEILIPGANPTLNNPRLNLDDVFFRQIPPTGMTLFARNMMQNNTVMGAYPGEHMRRPKNINSMQFLDSSKCGSNHIIVPGPYTNQLRLMQSLPAEFDFQKGNYYQEDILRTECSLANAGMTNFGGKLQIGFIKSHPIYPGQQIGQRYSIASMRTLHLEHCFFVGCKTLYSYPFSRLTKGFMGQTNCPEEKKINMLKQDISYFKKQTINKFPLTPFFTKTLQSDERTYLLEMLKRITYPDPNIQEQFIDLGDDKHFARWAMLIMQLAIVHEDVLKELPKNDASVLQNLIKKIPNEVILMKILLHYEKISIRGALYARYVATTPTALGKLFPKVVEILREKYKSEPWFKNALLTKNNMTLHPEYEDKLLKTSALRILQNKIHPNFIAKVRKNYDMQVDALLPYAKCSTEIIRKLERANIEHNVAIIKGEQYLRVPKINIGKIYAGFTQNMDCIQELQNCENKVYMKNI